MAELINKKDFIIDCICKMDMEMLNLVLDDSIKFMENGKKEFLTKLDAVFDQFREAGDTELYKELGCCRSSNCPNRGCEGLAFIGDVTGKHIDFVITEDRGDILDIHWCQLFKLYGFEGQLEVSKHIDFNPLKVLTEDEFWQYALNFVKIQNAVVEINSETGQRFLETKELISWLENHEALFRQIILIKHYHKQLFTFVCLYNELDRLGKFLTQESIAGQAMDEYRKIEMGNEVQFLNWMVKYEEIGRPLLETFDCIFDSPDPKHTAYFKLTYGYNLFIPAIAFENIIAFKQIFLEHYWTSFRRYNTLTREASLEKYSQHGDNCQEMKLSYHLKLRGLV